jgi:hypothetical protein
MFAPFPHAYHAQDLGQSFKAVKPSQVSGFSLMVLATLQTEQFIFAGTHGTTAPHH